MSTEAQETTEQQASATSTATADASFRTLVSSWKAVLHSFKLKFHSQSDLVAADFQLSVKALALTVLCILLFVGLSLVLWSTLLITVTYALVTLGWHWALCATVVILLNLLAMSIVKRLLSSAMSSISMKATAEALLSSDKL